MTTEPPLTDEQLDALSDRMSRRRVEQEHALRQPLMLKQMTELQEAKRQERVAAAQAKEDLQRRARVAAEERRRREWEANRPQREAAERDLAALRPMIAVLEQQLDGLRDRELELEEIAAR